MGEIRTKWFVSIFYWRFFFLLRLLDAVGQFSLRYIFRRTNFYICVCDGVYVCVCECDVRAKRHWSMKLSFFNLVKINMNVLMYQWYPDVFQTTRRHIAKACFCYVFRNILTSELHLHAICTCGFAFFIFRCGHSKSKMSSFVFFLHIYVCSSKHLKALSKENTSPFFLETDGKNPISRYIYNLLTDGIKGNTKKDTLLSILSEIAVRKWQIQHSVPQY